MDLPRLVRRPEVLAPAGDEDSLRAAVRAGADAVYFGLQGFNARARARNFDAAVLGQTLAYLHTHGARGYVTLNTLVFDSELSSVEAAVRTCAEAGVDAVIVQDLGVARLVHAMAPDLPVHASTQMTCTDAASVELARDLGARRVILARELSLEDIAAIRAATDVELEVFVHGALCVAYSGQCLTSEAIGGRSANRGACAQACRLPYELVVDGVLRELGDKAYLLSPQDLEASASVAALVSLGISSLKIEGRLKGPAYVAATTRLYRAAIDAAMARAPAPTEAVRDAALQMFTRGSGPGFFPGVDHQRLVAGDGCDHRGLKAGTCTGVRTVRGRALLAVTLERPMARGDGVLVQGGRAGEGELGGRVWALTRDGMDVPRAESGDSVLVWLGPERDVRSAVAGRSVWKTNDPETERAVTASIDRDPHRTRVDVTVTGTLGERPVFQAVTARGVTARVEGDVAIAHAEVHAPLVHGVSTGIEGVLRDKLGRLGDSPFVLGTLTATLPEGAVLPVSMLNRARRALVEGLSAAAQRSWPVRETSHEVLVTKAVPPRRPPPPGGLYVLCRNLPQARAALEAGADGVYLDFLELTGTGAAVRALRAERPGACVGVAPPRVRKPGEEKINRYLATLATDAVLVRGLGALWEREAMGDALRIGDFSLNVTNRLSAAEVLGGVSRRSPPRLTWMPCNLAPWWTEPSGRGRRWCCTTRCRCFTWSTACLPRCSRTGRTFGTVDVPVTTTRSPCVTARGWTTRWKPTWGAGTRYSTPRRRARQGW